MSAIFDLAVMAAIVAILYITLTNGNTMARYAKEHNVPAPCICKDASK